MKGARFIFGTPPGQIRSNNERTVPPRKDGCIMRMRTGLCTQQTVWVFRAIVYER